MTYFKIYQILFFSTSILLSAIYLFQYKLEIKFKRSSNIGWTDGQSPIHEGHNHSVGPLANEPSIQVKINNEEQYINNKQECLSKLYIDPPNSTTENIFGKLINNKMNPTTVKEVPVGHAPSVPEEFFIEEKDFCHRKKYTTIAYIHSTIPKVENRQNIRKTWGFSSEQLGAVFMVGKAKNEVEQKIVENESAQFHDIVQGNYTDLYRLLTYKALNSIYWLSKNCGHIQWVVHADDDVVIDIFLLLQNIKQFEKNRRTNEIFCHANIEMIASPRGKWGISRSEYPCSTFPKYCKGAFWFSSMKVIIKLYRSTPKAKYIWIDDVYLTGVLAEISNVNRTLTALRVRDFNTNDIGKYVAWYNIKVINSVITHWNSIRSYYNKKMMKYRTNSWSY